MIPDSSASRRAFRWLLLFGILLRCVALTQPLVDAHLLRQCQTAAATRALIAEPGFHLSTRIPWVGDFDERFVAELPLYNFLVAALHAAIGHLTLSGKLVAVLLWALSFCVLQPLWRRMLDPVATTWANLLFVVAPLGVFFGQAFMPESIVQLTAFAFVLLLVRHEEMPTLARWWAAAAAGCFGLILKSTETAHLYVILLWLVLARAGWRGLFAPRLIVGGILSAAAVYAWGVYFNSVNVTPLSFGGTSANLHGFIGPLALRFHSRPWIMIAFYLAAFVAPGFSAIGVLRGAWEYARGHRPPLLGAWLAAVAVFYLLWLGNGPSGQSYYNLPALAPCCALFGIGMRALLAPPRLSRWRRAASIAAAALTVACAVPGWLYLFRPDRPILAAARWAREHTEPGALFLFDTAHRADMRNYAQNAVFTFYAGRPAFVWAGNLPEPYRTAALDRPRYAIVTQPAPESALLRRIRELRGFPPAVPEPTDWLAALGFARFAEGDGFIVLRRQP